MSAKRIQLRRTKGWRKPEGAVVVARPTKWGNPWHIGPSTTRAEAVESYRRWLEGRTPGCFEQERQEVLELLEIANAFT